MRQIKCVCGFAYVEYESSDRCTNFLLPKTKISNDNILANAKSLNSVYVTLILMTMEITILFIPGLFHRSYMMSGSAYSSWALVDDPVHYAVQLASSLNCSIPRYVLRHNL